MTRRNFLAALAWLAPFAAAWRSIFPPRYVASGFVAGMDFAKGRDATVVQIFSSEFADRRIIQWRSHPGMGDVIYEIFPTDSPLSWFIEQGAGMRSKEE
jgi:hypothetical protein